MTERFCGNCAHEGSGSISCAHCDDDDYSGWTPLPDDRDTELASRAEVIASLTADVESWRRQAETDAETVEECKARLTLQADEIARLRRVMEDR